MSKSEHKKESKHPKAIVVENQGVFIPKDVKNPIADGMSHEISKGRVGGNRRMHPPINVNEVD